MPGVCKQFTGQHANLAMPCVWSAQSVLSSHYAPFLTLFLGEVLSVQCACVYLGSECSRLESVRVGQ